MEETLGYDTNGKDHLTPRKVEALAGEVIVDVACGEDHTCAVTATGSIYTWGRDVAIGHDGMASDDFELPRIVRGLSTKYLVCVSSNASIAASVTRDGEVHVWGDSPLRYYGARLGHVCGARLGHVNVFRQDTPKRVEALIGVKAKQVACGLYHTAVCTEDGEVFTFGGGEHGELGHGDKEYKTSPVLVKALQGKYITQVQCGEHHTMALISSGYVFT